MADGSYVVSGFPPPPKASARHAKARFAREGGSRTVTGPPEGGQYVQVEIALATLRRMPRDDSVSRKPNAPLLILRSPACIPLPDDVRPPPPRVDPEHQA